MFSAGATIELSLLLESLALALASIGFLKSAPWYAAIPPEASLGPGSNTQVYDAGSGCIVTTWKNTAWVVDSSDGSVSARVMRVHPAGGVTGFPLPPRTDICATSTSF